MPEMPGTFGSGGINTQLPIAQHQIAAGRPVTYFSAEGKPIGTTSAGGEFYSVGTQEDILFQNRDIAMQYARAQGARGQVVGESNIPSSDYQRQKEAESAYMRAQYGVHEIKQPVSEKILSDIQKSQEPRTLPPMLPQREGEIGRVRVGEIVQLPGRRLVGTPEGTLIIPETTTQRYDLPSLRRDINTELGLSVLNVPRGKPIDVSWLPSIAVTPARPYVEPTNYYLQSSYDFSRQITGKASEYTDIMFPQSRPFEVPGLFPTEFTREAVRSIGSAPEFFATVALGYEMMGRDIIAGKGKDVFGRVAIGTGAIVSEMGIGFKTSPIGSLGSFAGQMLLFEGISRVPLPRGLTVPKLNIPERTFYDPLTGATPRSMYVKESLDFLRLAPDIKEYVDLPTTISAIFKISRTEGGLITPYTEAGYRGMLGEIPPIESTKPGYFLFKPDIRGVFSKFYESPTIAPYYESGVPGTLGTPKAYEPTGRGYFLYKPDIQGEFINIYKGIESPGFAPYYESGIPGYLGRIIPYEPTGRGYFLFRPDIKGAFKQALLDIGFKPDIRGAFGDISFEDKPRGFIGYKTDIFQRERIGELWQRLEQSGYVAKEKAKGKYKSIQERITEELNRPVRYFGEYGKKVEYEPYPTLKERKVTGTIRLIKGKYGEPTEPKAFKPKTIEAAGIKAKIAPSRRMTRGEEVLRQATKEPITTPKQIIEQIPSVTEKPKEQLSPYALVFGGAPVLAGTQLLKGGRSGLSFKTPSERIEEMFFSSAITQRTKPKERQKPEVKPGESSILKPAEIIISRPKELPKERPKELPRERTRDLTRDLSRDLVRDVTREATRESQRDTQIQRELEIFRPPKPILLQEERKKRKYTPKFAEEKYFQTFRGVNLIQPLAGVNKLFKMPAKPSHKKSRKGRR